jgi:hypothetical protein
LNQGRRRALSFFVVVEGFVRFVLQVLKEDWSEVSVVANFVNLAKELTDDGLVVEGTSSAYSFVAGRSKKGSLVLVVVV